MKIGNMRRQIYLYEVTTGQPDGMGGFTTTESARVQTWVEVKILKGKRAFDFNQSYNSQPYVFTIRTDSYSNLSYDTQLVYEDNLYTIYSISDDDMKKYTEIIAWV